jgi:hypothetical protein
MYPEREPSESYTIRFTTGDLQSLYASVPRGMDPLPVQTLPRTVLVEETVVQEEHAEYVDNESLDPLVEGVDSSSLVEPLDAVVEQDSDTPDSILPSQQSLSEKNS